MRMIKTAFNRSAIAAGLRYLAITAPLVDVHDPFSGQFKTVVGRGTTINMGRRKAKNNTWKIKQEKRRAKRYAKLAYLKAYPGVTSRIYRGYHSSEVSVDEAEASLQAAGF